MAKPNWANWWSERTKSAPQRGNELIHSIVDAMDANWWFYRFKRIGLTADQWNLEAMITMVEDFLRTVPFGIGQNETLKDYSRKEIKQKFDTLSKSKEWQDKVAQRDSEDAFYHDPMKIRIKKNDVGNALRSIGKLLQTKPIDAGSANAAIDIAANTIGGLKGGNYLLKIGDEELSNAIGSCLDDIDIAIKDTGILAALADKGLVAAGEKLARAMPTIENYCAKEFISDTELAGLLKVSAGATRLALSGREFAKGNIPGGIGLAFEGAGDLILSWKTIEKWLGLDRFSSEPLKKDRARPQYPSGTVLAIGALRPEKTDKNKYPINKLPASAMHVKEIRGALASPPPSGDEFPAETLRNLVRWVEVVLRNNIYGVDLRDAAVKLIEPLMGYEPRKIADFIGACENKGFKTHNIRPCPDDPKKDPPTIIYHPQKPITALEGVTPATVETIYDHRPFSDDGYAVGTFAAGGIVSGPTLAIAGEYPGARNNPEVIAPLSKLTDILRSVCTNAEFIDALRSAIDFTSVMAPLQAVQPSTIVTTVNASRTYNQSLVFNNSFSCTDRTAQMATADALDKNAYVTAEHLARLIRNT